MTASSRTGRATGRALLLLVAAGLALSACAGKKGPNVSDRSYIARDVKTLYNFVKDKLNKGRYKQAALTFDEVRAKTIIEKKGFWNFFNPVVKDCSIWHAPFQSGRILPDKRKYPDIKFYSPFMISILCMRVNRMRSSKKA